MKTVFVSLILICSFSASADELNCSIHPIDGTARSALPSLAKIKLADAKDTAMAGYKGRSPIISDGELVVENNCLIYTFEVRFAGTTGAEDVIVDAGTGANISQKHATPEQEAAEVDAMIKDGNKH